MGGMGNGQRNGEVDEEKLSTSIPLHVSSGDTSKV
jgi:hypothetical protein